MKFEMMIYKIKKKYDVSLYMAHEIFDVYRRSGALEKLTELVEE